MAEELHAMQAGERVEFAHTLRGIAALLVVFVHYFDVFFSSNLSTAIYVPPVGTLRPPELSWMFSLAPIQYGPIGVAIFFLVSGFVIPFSLRRLSAKGFLVARFFRLWPTYVVGFSLSVAAFAALYADLDVKWPFTVVNILVQYVIVLRDWIGSPNLDGIVWTLEIEVKFYLICATAALLFRRYSLLVFLLPLGLLCIFAALMANVGWLGSGALRAPTVAIVLAVPYLIYMFIGTAFHYLHVGKLSAQQAIFIIGALYCAQIAVVLSGPAAPRIAEYWNYGYALIIFAFAAAFPSAFRKTPVTTFFADISYPLYVVHNIVGYAMFRIMLNAGVSLWMTLVVMWATAISLAWLLHVLVERPSQKYGRAFVRPKGTPAVYRPPS